MIWILDLRTEDQLGVPQGERFKSGELIGGSQAETQEFGSGFERPAGLDLARRSQDLCDEVSFQGCGLSLGSE